MKPKFILLLLILIISASSSFGQKRASLVGTVSDAITNESLPGANIYLEGTSIGGTTNDKGGYSIASIPAGKYTVVVSYIGYKKIRMEMEFKEGEIYKEDIKLSYSGANELEEVKVTAQAKGQMKAINQQLSSQDIRNVVSAERIRELPDANAAEALGRLPGVSVLRSGGEGEKVVVRGLSPNYNKITLDGVEMASTGNAFRSSAETSGSTNSFTTSGSEDRSVNLNMISAFSLEGMEVVKAHNADMDADFIGGTVNFKMRKAPAGGFKSEVIGLWGYNNLGNTFRDYNVNAIIADRFFNEKLGLFVQANMESRNRSSNSMSISSNYSNLRIDEETDEQVYDRHYIGNLFMSDVQRIRNRKGASLVLDYKLPGGDIAFKNNISSSNDNVSIYELYANVSRGDNQTTIRTSFEDETRLTYSNMLQYEQRIGSFLLDGNLSWSFAETSAPADYSLEATDFLLFEGVDSDPPDEIAKNVFADAMDEPEEYTINNTAKNFNLTSQGQYEGSLNAKWFFTLSKTISGSIKAGGKYRHQERSHDYEFYDGNFNSGGTQPPVIDTLQLHYPDIFLPEYRDGGIGRMRFKPFIDYNYKPTQNFLNEYGTFIRGASKDMVVLAFNDVQNSQVPQKIYHNRFKHHAPKSQKFDYNGIEDYTAAYLMATFHLTSFVDLTPGVRYERNRTEYTGKRGNTQASGELFVEYRPIASDIHRGDTTTVRENSFFLPSIHMKIKPLKWLQFHLAYTNTLSRPGYSSIIPILDIRGPNNIRFNRYDLQPEKSENYDIVTSIHHNYIGLFSVNLFSKKITNKIFNRSGIIGDLHELMRLPVVYGVQQGSWDYNDTINPVYIKGVEMEWQTNFWYLPGALKGIVLNINYTHINSEATYIQTEIGDSASIPGDPFSPRVRYDIDRSYKGRLVNQPADILNVSLGYDYKGFSGRVSLYYQSNVFKGNSFWEVYRSYEPTYYRFDLSLKQRLPVKGMKVFLNLNNINKALDIRKQNGYPDFPTRFSYYGMTGEIGLIWLFSNN